MPLAADEVDFLRISLAIFCSPLLIQAAILSASDQPHISGQRRWVAHKPGTIRMTITRKQLETFLVLCLALVVRARAAEPADKTPETRTGAFVATWPFPPAEQSDDLFRKLGNGYRLQPPGGSGMPAILS